MEFSFTFTADDKTPAATKVQAFADFIGQTYLKADINGNSVTVTGFLHAGDDAIINLHALRFNRKEVSQL